MDAWFRGICKECNFPVVVIPISDKKREELRYSWDYHCYCSNKECDLHKGSYSKGSEVLPWVKIKK